MAHRVRADVKSALLVWARESAGYSQEQAAKKIAVSVDAIIAWEGNDAAPTITQLQKMADVYKRPLAVFYLPEPPLAFMPMKDFRRLPGSGIRSFSPELSLEMRVAQQHRKLALELLADVGERVPEFTVTAALGDDPETVGERLRAAIGATDKDRTAWASDRMGYAAFNWWRSRIEALGILVFQAARVSADEVSGFAISELPLPVIVVSRADTPPRRRTFSLLHELAHLALRVSGVSELDVDAARPPEDQRIEVFCNRVAAAALMPKSAFLAEPEIRGHRKGDERWNDDQIRALSLRYGVSREVVVRRLMTFGLTSQAFYRAKRDQYNKEYRAQREKARATFKDSGAEFRRNPPVETLTNLGRPLVRIILDSYHDDRMSLSDVSSYLGIRARHVQNIDAMSSERTA